MIASAYLVRGKLPDIMEGEVHRFDAWGQLTSFLLTDKDNKIARQEIWRVTLMTTGAGSIDITINYGHRDLTVWSPEADLKQALHTMAIQGRVADFFLQAHAR